MARTLRDIMDNIENARAAGDFFFKPWIGYNYLDGLKLFGETKRRVLIIGASRYCIWSWKRKEMCEHLGTCSWFRYPDLKAISKDCSYVNEGNRRNNTNPDLGLEDINTAAILEYYYYAAKNKFGEKDYESSSYDDIPNAYINFTNNLYKAAGLKDKEDLWKHVAFMNYIQPLVGADRTETPRYRDATTLYELSKAIVEEQIRILDPEVILLWVSSPLYSVLDSKLFSTKPRKVGAQIVLGRNKTYHDMLLTTGNIERRLLPCPHPSGNLFRDYVNKKSITIKMFTEKDILNTDFSKEYTEDVEYTWEDFAKILRVLGSREIQGTIDMD